MSDKLFAGLAAQLQERDAAGLTRRRRLLETAQGVHIKCDGQTVLSFCSNDYLGLANDPELINAWQQSANIAGVGSGASHLITGHHHYHELLEKALADFIGLPAALLFSTGYMANLGIMTALLGRGDAVFADRLNHASLNDAAVLSRAELYRYPHNDLSALEAMLKTSNAPRKLVVADAVFSMDGDLTPVPALLALCEKYDALLLLDDAHGFGVLGKEGRGTLSHFNLTSPRIIYMATLGKAAGVFGAFVAADQIVIDYLLQNARTYIYTTASPPAISATLIKALEIIKRDESRRVHLQGLISLLKSGLQLKRWKLEESVTAIQPLIVGSNEEALALSEYLLTKNILVPAIRPPTVPKDTARLRISLSAAHSEHDVAQLIQSLNDAESEMAA
ncbi:8-amino-7-oxononanoate synthase [Methylovorus sp. MM2]|uniref:8-amino-7-oxononanoate synthase n=1 Tax=Methylovorus sp. MM2 TaxID=1848038 RepID=UPI0007DF0A37|nr:8-amino-7-oxononanoate synthase [Methylovorus sp. MM2]OAM51427.1 8-amino-7-oxononanoate synthase [Methylovorus sp. MM2]